MNGRMHQKAIDISRTISADALVYPGRNSIRINPTSRPTADGFCNTTQIEGWTTHLLTHVDLPLHFVAGGASLDEVPLDRFIGRALVVEIEDDAVMADHVHALGDVRGWNVLFKTRNSSDYSGNSFNENHVYVTRTAAELLVEKGVNMVGIDYLSVDRYGDHRYPTHRTLLGANILILEGIDLSQVEPGPYILSALPLKIAKGDGSPVRAVLTQYAA